jgi:mono/diheme cytochrome c family protein
MRPLPAMLLCAAFAAALSGCHRKPSLTPLQAQGKQLFDVGCAHCHVQNDQHLTPAPPDLRGLFTHNSMPDGAPATDAEVEHILTAGKGSMPSFAYQMNHRQMEAVIAYLHVYAAPSHP